MSRIFDTTTEAFLGQCEEKRNFIIENYNKEITEADFIQAMSEMPKHLHWSNGHSPSRSRDNYKNLKEKFGLFQPDAEIKL